jgi:hypothetical protein
MEHPNRSGKPNTVDASASEVTHLVPQLMNPKAAEFCRAGGGTAKSCFIFPIQLPPN